MVGGSVSGGSLLLVSGSPLGMMFDDGALRDLSLGDRLWDDVGVRVQQLLEQRGRGGCIMV